MRAILQRVTSASVRVDDEVTGSIDFGLMVLLGAGEGDSEADLDYVLDKTLHLRIFPDDAGKMNMSLLEVGGQMLVVSQFTLYGDTRKGRRPSFVKALEPVEAERLYDQFVARARARGVHVETGRFGALMNVSLVNHGPVTLILDSSK
ncbi:MAG: D-aminoacyl-tRNA deacylase, partial [Myxococcota bacterium]